MKHHFGDFLERTSDYWTTIPNSERFAFIADFEIANKDEVKILTISKAQDKKHWEQIFNCPYLEELTLHDPSKEQVQAIRKLTNIKRLRVTFFRATDIEFIGDLENLEELILEYVSGFSDLTPLRKLKKLKSVHFENLRRVKDFSGLAGISSLRYLYIDGTFDWKQPVENFEFLKDLPNLEVLNIYGITNKTPFPVFKSLISHKKLYKIKMAENTFHTKDYAFLAEALPNVEGIHKDFKIVFDYNPIGYLSEDDIRSKYTVEKLKIECPGIRVLADGRREYGDLDSEYYLFVGKGAGKIKCNNPKVEQKLAEFKKQYEQYKLEAKELIKSYCG